MRLADWVSDPLPEDFGRATLVGRVWDPEAGGPCAVAIRDGEAVDITVAVPTMRDLCEADDPAALARSVKGRSLGALADILTNTPREDRDAEKPWLLAPVDLQAIKAAGVTFVVSMLERVIEEQARGEAARANEIRTEIRSTIGDDLRRLKPGSEQAMALKELLVRRKDVVAVPGSRNRPGCGGVHQGAADVGRRASGGGGAEPDLVVEQSRARGGARRIERGKDRRRDARQRREPARCGRPLGAAARQGQGQQCECRDRPVHPALRQRLHARRRATGGAATDRRGGGQFPPRGRKRHGEDQPRPGGPGSPDDRQRTTSIRTVSSSISVRCSRRPRIVARRGRGLPTSSATSSAWSRRASAGSPTL